MRRKQSDPHWIIAKWAGTDKYGTPFKKGDRVWYWPLNRKIVAGEEAEQAARDFEAYLFDEGDFWL